MNQHNDGWIQLFVLLIVACVVALWVFANFIEDVQRNEWTSDRTDYQEDDMPF